MIQPHVFILPLLLCASFFAAPDGMCQNALDVWQPAKGWREVASVISDALDKGQFLTTDGTGVLLADGKADWLTGKHPHGDAEIHVEFNIPTRSNSGVYVMGSYEVQIYDSHNVPKDQYPGIECGGIYPEWIGNANVRGHSPSVNAALPAGQWQSYDIVFRAPASMRKAARLPTHASRKSFTTARPFMKTSSCSAPRGAACRKP
jgi:hypothetical protein